MRPLPPIYAHAPFLEQLRSLAQSRLCHHAFLLVGPEGQQKRELLVHFASFLENRGEAATVPEELHEVLPSQGATKVNVQDVREALTLFSLKPSKGKRRFLLFPHLDRATTAAQNALLKVVEDPPEGHILLASTAFPGGVLPTLRSRFQVLFLPSTKDGLERSREDLRKAFPHLSEEETRKLLMLSGGRRRVFALLAKNDHERRKREAWESFLTRLLRSQCSWGEVLAFSEALSKKEREEISLFLSFVGDMLESNAREMPLKRRAEILEEVLSTSILLQRTNAHPRLLLERLCIILGQKTTTGV